MPSTTVNFADVDSFEPLPEGLYDVEIDKVEVRRNKADDGDYLNWELLVIDGEYENRRLWMITSLKPTALFRLKQCFEDLGIIDGDDEEVELEYDDDVEVSNSGGPRILYPELEGLEAVATVKNEMYDGREKNRVEQLGGPQKRSKKKARKVVDSDNNQVAKARAKSRRRDEDEDEEEEERPRRSRRRSSEDEDDKPRSSRRRKDEDEDEPKSRRRSRDEDDDDDDDDDEEEEEAPRRSSRSRTQSRSRDKARRRVR